MNPIISINARNLMYEKLHSVASGEYATESEVIRDGLRALMARDQAVEAWLRTEVAAAYDALKASPSRSVRASQVRARLSAAHQKRSIKA